MRTYKLLVVDDEEYAVRGIAEGIPWNTLNIEQVYTAFDAKSAREVLEKEQIDIVISDIEMPGESGLKLLEWISDKELKTRVLLLTAYARFEYATTALRNGAIEYLLKPVDHEELKIAVLRCQDSLLQEDQSQAELVTLRQSLPFLIEKFWLDILESRKSLEEESLKQLNTYCNIPETANTMVTPVICILKRSLAGQGMLKIEEAYYTLLEWAHNDIFGKKCKGSGVIFEENLLFFFYELLEQEVTVEKIGKQIKEQFQLEMQFFIGKSVLIKDLAMAYESLQVFLSSSNTLESVVSVEEAWEGQKHPREKLPLVVDWLPMLENGKEDEFHEKIAQMFFEMKQIKEIGRDEMGEIYLGLYYIFTVAARRNGMNDVLQELGKPDKSNYYTIEHLEKWTLGASDFYFHIQKSMEKKNSSIIQKVEKYVMEHIAEDFKREDIANALYFNSSYLSHVFKAEKGISLNKFINQLRIQEAKRLFDTTNLPVGNIAMDTGYYNFSYFSKQFKEIYHVTPSEYKKSTSIC